MEHNGSRFLPAEDIEAVTDEEIATAYKLVASEEAILCEPASDRCAEDHSLRALETEIFTHDGSA